MKKSGMCMFNSELLVAYTSGNVDFKERTIVEQHLAQCPRCRQEVMELEQTWWALDVWQEELGKEPVVSRPKFGLEDLHRRIAVTETEQHGWNRFYDFFHRVKSGFNLLNEHYVLRPAMAAAVVGATLYFYPAVQQTLESPAMPPVNRALQFADVKTTPEASRNTPPVQMASYDRTEEKRLETEFKQAVQQSRREPSGSNVLLRLDWNGNPQNAQFTSVGFSPSADVIPPQQNTESLKPSIVNPVYMTSGIRLNH